MARGSVKWSEAVVFGAVAASPQLACCFSVPYPAAADDDGVQRDWTKLRYRPHAQHNWSSGRCKQEGPTFVTGLMALPLHLAAD